MPKEIIRRCIFRPFLKGKGPTFSITVWDTGRYDGAFTGRAYLGYRLTMTEEGKRTVLFTGEDFSPSPMIGIDSDGAIESLMGFLTLRPGDTDREYFDRYTPEQLSYCERWAEALDCEVMSRFGEREERG